MNLGTADPAPPREMIGPPPPTQAAKLAALAIGLAHARRGTVLSVTYLLDSGGDAASLRAAVRRVQALVTVDDAVRDRALGLLRRAAAQSEHPSQGDRYRRPVSLLQARPAPPG